MTDVNQHWKDSQQYRLDSWLDRVMSPPVMKVDKNFLYTCRELFLNLPMFYQCPAFLFTVSGMGNANRLFLHLISLSQFLPENFPSSDRGIHFFLRRKKKAGRELPELATDRWWVCFCTGLIGDERLKGHWRKLFADQINGILLNEHETEQETLSSREVRIVQAYIKAEIDSLAEKISASVKDMMNVMVFSFANPYGKAGYRLSVLLTGFENRGLAILKGLQLLNQNPSVNSFSLLSSSDKKLHAVIGPDHESLIDGPYVILLQVNVYGDSWKTTLLKH